MKIAAPSFLSPLLLFVLAACTNLDDVSEVQKPTGAASPRARAFLEAYTKTYQKLYYASGEAEWASNTHIVEGDDTNLKRTTAANEALAAFTGSVENIEAARALLEERDVLAPLEVLQLEAVLYAAAQNPQTVPELVKQRIAAEARQTEKLYGFSFTLDGKEITPNEIDDGLREETDLARRRAVWESSKAVGPTLRSGLIELRGLRNKTVRALGYPDYFSYQTSQYGWTADELIAEVDRFNRELRPLFRELHTWARHELAARYGQPVPDLIPAHWLPNRWGQDWGALVEVEGLDLAGQLEQRGPEWLVEQAERFYVSLGFEKLPPVFWERSSLYPLPPDAGYKKNNHASAWHLDLERDVRSLMSVEPTAEWYETTHHELGHIYYYLSYTNPRVPPLLREGADSRKTACGHRPSPGSTPGAGRRRPHDP
jgi:peptidyl-dipeptidase A